MIFLKNLFLLLLLSVALFAQEGIITSQEIISTDSPEELIGNEVDTYKSLYTQNLDNIEEQIQSTIETINTTPVEETTIIVNEPVVSNSQPKEQIVPTPNETKGTLKKTFSEAVAQAKEEHKIILLEIYGTNCHFCEKMESEVFPKESVIEELRDNFILLKINGDIEEIPLGISMQMTPMHVFITENEDIKDMTFGFLDEKDFLELLDREKIK